MVLTVAHITTVHPRFDTRIFYREVIGLKKELGVEIDLFVFDGKGDQVVDSVRIYDLGHPPGNRLFRFIKGSYFVFRRLIKSNHNVLHFHDPELIIVMYLISYFGKKVVFDIHESVAESIKVKSWIPSACRGILSALYRFIEAIALRRFKTVLAETSYERLYPKADVIVRNFPDIDMIEKNNVGINMRGEKNKILLCYLGVVSTSRGVLNYSKAVLDLREQGLNVELLVVGPIRNDIESNAEFILGVTHGFIKTYGRLPSNEALRSISRCDVGLAVLYDEANYRDSYPTKIFEYMALKMPFITSNFMLYKEVALGNKCGLVVDPNNLEQLKDAIIKYYFDSELRKLYGQLGYNAVREKYSWQTELKKLVDFYGKLRVNM